ncbi:sigma 54-interacting transcriptional regulator [Salimicrobium flavidum]|uniref:PAS domain S-box-containing protein n=1 Tax=Salimicrobium flavidum TaxID=570947 RepID=A0A1N7KR53_9BACI|nr:sigma 54-interacting transcriptional regulator [Salimicrobium flavidum]SIS63976.1 PAS domain S-box-containing protein [Salimicrobium flavidum]
MIKIALIVPETNFIENAYRIFEKHNQVEAVEEDSVDTFHMEEIVVEGDRLKSYHFDCDVIISRGILAQTLKNNSQEIPVVDIPVPGYDLIKSLHLSKTTYGKKKTAVIGSQNMIFGVESLSEIINIPIKSYILKNHRQNEELVNSAIEDGYEVIIGGKRTCEYAEEISVSNIFIRTGEEALWQAITEAKRLAKAGRKELERAKRYKAILDYAYEGIIATNTNGEITAFNKASQEILSVKSKAITGNFIDKIIPNGRLHRILVEEQEVENEIVNYKNTQLMVRKVNIKFRENIVGHVVTFQDVSGIQSMEGEIRKKIYTRGHVAKYHFEDILYESSIMEKAVSLSKRYSKTQSNILLHGETGTGKELFAQSIHNYSEYSSGPFVAVNCGALPEELLESELFGYAEGAFTGASKKGKPGVFELAHDGTIFLDEISEMPLNLQTRLLRVLQEREITRLGDDKVIPINVRVIAATNKELFDLLGEEFRRDLYYRLEVLKIELPSLKQRPEDIEFLIENIIHSFQAREDKEINFTPEAVELMKQQRYDGNVRQLQNICERLFVLYDNEVTASDVKYVLTNERDVEPLSLPYTNGNSDTFVERQDLEKQYYQDVLKKTNYNKKEAAKRLGISRTTLWRRMKNLGLLKYPDS